MDPVNNALRQRKNFYPRGWRLFAKVLGNVNIPEIIVRLKTIRDH